MNIKRILYAIVNFFRICIIGEESFLEKEKIENGILRIRKQFTSINAFKLLFLFVISFICLVALWVDTFLNKIKLIIIGLITCICMSMFIATTGAYNWILIGKDGITEIKFWDDLLNNGVRKELKWEEFNNIRVVSDFRAGAIILAEYEKGILRIDFTYEVFNFIKQYYPNIDVWIELDESKVK